MIFLAPTRCSASNPQCSITHRRVSQLRAGPRCRATEDDAPSTSSYSENNGAKPVIDPVTKPGPSLADPVATIQWGGTLPSGRRVAVSGLLGLSIVLGSNLLGGTSLLLGLDGGRFAAQQRLDVLVPVRGFKRCVDYQNGFEFVYPATWLADQRLYRRYAERMERERSLDLPSLRSRRRPEGPPEPAAAFGPAGSTGEENASVIVAPIRDGFRVQGLGTPEEAATRFLENTVAPDGSGRTATLLASGSRTDAADNLYYWMEFLVEGPGRGGTTFRRHNVSSYVACNGLLYTFTCQCTEGADWERDGAALREAARSFRLINSGAAVAGFPGRL